MSGDSRFFETRLGQWMDLAACRGTVTSADEDIFFAPVLDEQAAATVARLILEGSETNSMGSPGSDAANSAAKTGDAPTPERR